MDPIFLTSFLLLVTGIGAYETTPHIILEGGPITAAPDYCCNYPVAVTGVNIIEGYFLCNETLKMTCTRKRNAVYVSILGISPGENFTYSLQSAIYSVTGSLVCDTKTSYWDYNGRNLGRQFKEFRCGSFPERY